MRLAHSRLSPVKPSTVTDSTVPNSTVPSFGRRSIRRVWLAGFLSIVFALVLTLTGATQTQAQPGKVLPDSTERVISAAALRALTALNEFVNTGNLDRFDLYRVFADRLAVPVAVALDLNVGELQRSSADADLTRQRAIIAGLTQLGVPYRMYTSIPFKSFDCSGLTSYAWGIAGIEIARGSRAQFSDAAPIKAEQAQPGDLIWRPGHVAMYLGVPGAVLQAPYGGRSVEIQLMNERISKWVRYADPLA